MSNDSLTSSFIPISQHSGDDNGFRNQAQNYFTSPSSTQQLNNINNNNINNTNDNNINNYITRDEQVQHLRYDDTLQMDSSSNSTQIINDIEISNNRLPVNETYQLLESTTQFDQLQQYYQRHYQQQELYNQQFQQLHRSSSQLLSLHNNMTRQNSNSNNNNPLSSTSPSSFPLINNLSNDLNRRQLNNLKLNKQKKSQNRIDSNINEMISNNNINTCPYGCCNTPNIPEYLFLNGLVKGNHYDVIIRAFGKKYKLHKLFLDRSPYFKSLFSWSENLKSNNKSNLDSDSDSDSGSDSSINLKKRKNSNYRKIYDLPFEEDSSSGYKQKSFELAISRLYGAINLKEEYKIPYNMIEIGQYLAINEIVCTASDYIVKNMEMSNLAENLRFAINSDYGSASQRIIENGKGILCSNGWEYGPDSWDGIPTLIAADVLGEDYFFVPTEWDRCIFIIKLIERRLENLDLNLNDENDNIEPLKKVLNEKIHYCHMPPSKLQELEELVDVNGENYIKPQVLHTSLWQAVQLETLISRSEDIPHLANIITNPIPPTSNHKWFKVPSKDETLSGLPKELDILLSQSLSETSNNQLNSDDSKTTQGENNNFNHDKKNFFWTKIPPFRFSISFANVSELSTDRRVYGKTFWYAGSYWNLYLQKSHIQSKNSYQVGVYLHRAHNGSSNSSSKSGIVNPDVYANNINYKTLPKIYSKKSGFYSVNNSYFVNEDDKSNKIKNNNQNLDQDNNILVDNLGLNMDNLSISEKRVMGESIKGVNKNHSIYYEDQRSAIKVYFIIFTPSRRSMPTITSFLSVPNDFSKSQSWGWKSNNMCVFNEDGTFAEGQDSNLKFMILLGNV